MLRHPLSYIKFLLELGADRNFGRAITYISALHLAVSNDTPDTLLLLLSHRAQVKGSKALLGAAMGGGLEMLKILAKHSPEDINDMPAPDEEWSDGERGTTGTALRTAARLGHVETVKYLLDKGTDPGLRDARGRTARELAKAKGNIEAVSLLQEH
ncbi:hypothetical protein MPH_13210 [Macrophomina phaseolina MS6]|uniref:Uncharacterized protein n=1 Tax=Macrophomina phaseolina (strain MS6) TaxID=1126212 RepID=K2R688_MACPH|nr:hypothetical protein MPH_13210 [Macrophomina phaseolina MS6]